MSAGNSVEVSRPARVEVGQRWVEDDPKATPYVVVAVDPSKGAQIEFDDGYKDRCWHKSASILRDSFLGHGSPALETPREPTGTLLPVKPQRREVSTNGRDWLNYDALIDSDPFEAYKHRRVDGVVPEVPIRLCAAAVVQPAGACFTSGPLSRHGLCQRHEFERETALGQNVAALRSGR